ncbi:probable glucan 1,3-beta-glucosidase A [Trifolium pratense]|uniref:probable glucan 1,3-beta-glucosidase A n=1 Tax=Trifolium pratense TaxID=57577 RepID=UPI001E697ADF|nr:probable glucan 1,3-beta-glucosidase A [Trifolium pratense]
MEYRNYYLSFLVALCLSCPYTCLLAQNPPYKAVNLGNWLVAEGWMEQPSLFDGIVNKDLLDGTQVQLLSTKFQTYLAAENGGGADIVANRPSASGWETFRLWRVNETFFNFRVFNKQFVGISNQGGNKIVAVSNSPSNQETFQIIRNTNDPFKIRIRASNGLFLQVQSETSVTADYQGKSWEESDPSVFRMKIVRTLQGEYQLTNGLGPVKATQVLRDHWSSYITEQDFIFMSQNGLNAVRIPVGWWIAQNPTPKPFVEGSLAALDNAFTWAQNHGMKVIVDLHAVEGSQNGNDHSGTRDGFLEWGDSYIPQTVSVIDFLAERYGNRPSLGGIELMNEPQGVDIDSLKKYYKAGYDAVRKYNQNAYVIMSNPLGVEDSKILLSFVSGFNNVVLDVHYYNLYTDNFNNMNVQQNIDYINNERASDLSGVSSTNALSFVGEWTAEWKVESASKQDYQRYGQAQLDVYSRATFGWAYWSYKCQYNHWSLKWMIENGYIKL